MNVCHLLVKTMEVVRIRRALSSAIVLKNILVTYVNKVRELNTICRQYTIYQYLYINLMCMFWLVCWSSFLRVNNRCEHVQVVLVVYQSCTYTLRLRLRTGNFISPHIARTMSTNNYTSHVLCHGVHLN